MNKYRHMALVFLLCLCWPLQAMADSLSDRLDEIHQDISNWQIPEARDKLQAIVDEGKGDDKIIAVHCDDPSFNKFTDISELPSHTSRELKRFFEDYKTLENKEVVVDDLEGAQQAKHIILEALQFYRREESRLRGW